MVRLKLFALLKSRDISAYQLAKDTGMTEPRAYRLASEDGEFDRLEASALNTLCEYLKVQPGELIEWVPAKKRGKSRS